MGVVLVAWQEVDFTRAQHYADSIGAVCIETSAKTNVHVHDAFVDIGAWYRLRACGL